MKNFDKILTVSVLMCLFISCNNQLAELKNGAINNGIDIKHQIINISFDWEKKQVAGNTEIVLSIQSKTDTIILDAAKLDIESITLENGNSLNYKIDAKNDKLKIELNKEYKPNDELKLSIKYRTTHINESDPNNIWGSFGKGVRFFEPSLTEKERRKQIWSIGEPNLNKYWYPSIESPNDLRTTEFIATVEKPLMAISNGKLIDTKENNDNTRTYHWKSDEPHSNHLTSFVVGDYKVYQQEYKNVKLNNYGYPDEYIGTKESVVRLPDMMAFFSNLTGKEYPYDTYSQIFVQDFGGSKTGYATSTITENMVDDKTTHEDFLYLWDLTEGEALANQWFGSLIAIEDWRDVWLSKGFSRYVSGMYCEYKNGRDEFLLYQHSPDFSTYLNDWNSNNRIPVVTDNYGDLELFVNGNYPYSKGSLVLNMLRKEIGESKWEKVIKKYVAEYSNKIVSTKDFIKVVNAVSDEPMNWFFDQWIYGIGHPKFKIETNYNVNENQLYFTVKQTQKLDSLSKFKQAPFFQGKMVIEIDGVLENIRLEPKPENTFVFKLETEPKFVNFDFQSSWIKEVDFEKTQEELIEVLQNSNDVLAKVSAMQNLTAIANDSLATAETKSNIKSELRKVVSNKKYWWRTRLMALWQYQGLLTASNSNNSEFDAETTAMLLRLIKEEKSWVKSNAINVLGMTKNPKYAPIYIEALSDYSDRVVNMAAIALGKTKHPKAFDELIKLKDKPSWKNQSLISTLYGLKELQDPRAYDLAIKSLVDSDNPHWNLGTPVWDHRLAAAHTLVAIGKTKEAYPLIESQLKAAMKERNMNDIFYNALMISILKDPRGKDMFAELEAYFAKSEDALKAIGNLKSAYTM